MVSVHAESYVPAGQDAVHDVLPAGEEVPAGQFAHVVSVVAPDVVENLPIVQSVQPEPAVEYLPAAHCVHAVLRVLAPGDDDPAGQSRQAEPAGEYFPFVHVLQAVEIPLPAGEDHPAAQFSHDVELAADVEYLPSAQSSHAVFPLVSVYFPAVHSVHVAPFL